VWASNLEGLFRCQRDDIYEVRHEGKPVRDITCIKPEPGGILWVGSVSEGLQALVAGSLKRINLAPEQTPLGIHGIVSDSAGFYWMASNRGVFRAAREDLMAALDHPTTRVECHRFDLADGLPSVECSNSKQPICAKDSAGRLWFATSKGVATVDPTTLELNTLPPQVQIEWITYQTDRPRGVSTIESRVDSPFSSPLALPAGCRRIEIHYTGLSLVAPEKVRFQVKLEGQDVEWHEEPSSRVSEFYQLPAGAYVFHVRAANNDGVWSQNSSSLAFAVAPFIWQRLSFRIGALFLLFNAGGILAWWQSRSRHSRALGELGRSQQQQAELAHVARVSTMGELASSVAHELNQPLGAILSNAEAAELFLAQSPPALDEVREILADIRKDDERAGEVIRRMRTLLRKHELQMAPLELNSLVEDVFRLINADASLRKVALSAELSSRLPQIQGDQVHLQQVLLNLIINALEAMAGQPPEKRRLIVRTGLRGTEVEVSITDSGCGIDLTKLPRLFEAFFTTKPNGMGMGLSIARRIVEAHHGRIRAENNASGGATFIVTLPVGSPGANVSSHKS
jgi:signal transduction histidine kinase